MATVCEVHDGGNVAIIFVIGVVISGGAVEFDLEWAIEFLLTVVFRLIFRGGRAPSVFLSHMMTRVSLLPFFLDRRNLIPKL